MVFTAARVMHAGDTFPNKTTPIMDRNNGGSGLSYSGTLAKAAATPNVDHVITGHGATLPVADLKEYRVHRRPRQGRPGRQARRPDAGRGRQHVEGAGALHGYTQPQSASLRAIVQVIWDETR